MDPLLVITNKDAGTADQETLEVALEILRARTSVEVAATSDPGELDGVVDEGGELELGAAARLVATRRRQDRRGVGGHGRQPRVCGQLPGAGGGLGQAGGMGGDAGVDGPALAAELATGLLPSGFRPAPP